MKIYTDGSYDGKSGIGSWAFIAYDDKGEEIARVSDWSSETTINRMEYMAFIKAVEILSVERPEELITAQFLSDSQLLTKSYNEWIKGWKAKNWTKSTGGTPENMDLVLKLDAIRFKYPQIVVKWVKAHNGDRGNEAVDKLAVDTRHKKQAINIIYGDVDLLPEDLDFSKAVLIKHTRVKVVTVTEYLVPNDEKLEQTCHEWFSTDNLRKPHAERDSSKIPKSETFLYKELVE
jgi:ribonuclease HI